MPVVGRLLHNGLHAPELGAPEIPFQIGLNAHAPSSTTHHAVCDEVAARRSLERADLDDNRVGRIDGHVGLGRREQRVQQRASVPVDGERVAELTELEVDDIIEDEVERNVDAGHAYKARLDDDRQTGRRYQSCMKTQINQLTF